MAVPGDKATFVGGEDRPEVSSSPRVVMGGSGEGETGGDRVRQFLQDLRALDVRQLSGQSSDPEIDKEDKDQRDGPPPPKTWPDFVKYLPDHYKNTIDTILYGGEQLDAAGMSELLAEFPILNQQVHDAIAQLWNQSAP